MEELLQERLAALSLEQKVRLVTGADFWSLHDEPAAGLRSIVTSDGPAGVRGRLWDERDPSANVPSPTAPAATWDAARVDERALRELFLRPFELIMSASPWAVMAAYNGVNGVTMTESPLLRDVLKDEWGWDGMVVSDWMAARGTVGAGNAALDLGMPGPTGPFGDALVAAVRSGEVSAAAVDKVLRILRLAARVGALGDLAPAPAADSAAEASARADGAGPPISARPWSDGEIAAELRATAAASFVLARNHGSLLPLEAGSLRRVTVIGPNAAVARTLGGGSATVFPRYTVSPLDGLRAALPADVTHAPGVRTATRLAIADITSADVRFLDAAGTVIAAENREVGEFTWLGTLAPCVAAIEVHTTLRAGRAGEYLVGASGPGEYRLTLHGELAWEGELALRPDADVAEALFAPPQHGVPVTLAAGETLDVVLRREGGGAMVTFGLAFQPPFDEEDAELEHAVALAREADVAIVVVGTTPEVESEGFDRSTLALPGRQDELVRRVNGAQPRTVVVVNAGAPVLLPWLDEVPAVLLCWFPGQEAGNALADVIFGAVEPGGRLPTTWPASDEGLPSVTPVDGLLDYAEGLAIGYRGPAEPRLPFGHGLGYTSWEYLAMDGATVRLCNAGTRRGREVIQVYASRPDSALQRPPKWLVGFAVVEADPGEEIVIDIPLAPRAFEHWDGEWKTGPGVFVLEAGRSVADLRVSSTT